MSLIGWGPVINGAYPVLFKHCIWKRNEISDMCCFLLMNLPLWTNMYFLLNYILWGMFSLHFQYCSITVPSTSLSVQCSCCSSSDIEQLFAPSKISLTEHYPSFTTFIIFPFLLFLQFSLIHSVCESFTPVDNKKKSIHIIQRNNASFMSLILY